MVASLTTPPRGGELRNDRIVNYPTARLQRCAGGELGMIVSLTNDHPTATPAQGGQPELKPQLTAICATTASAALL